MSGQVSRGSAGEYKAPSPHPPTQHPSTQQQALAWSRHLGCVSGHGSRRACLGAVLVTRRMMVTALIPESPPRDV